MKLRRMAAVAVMVGSTIAAIPHRSQAVPLLAVDFGSADNFVQPGFSELAGTASQTTANATFGSYSVDLTGQGFDTATGSHSAQIGQTVRPLYRDYFYNNSEINGVGVELKISGVNPNTSYDLTLWSYDGD